MTTPKRPEIATETVCRIVAKAVQFGAKEGVVEVDPGSNPTDDGVREVLADYAGDPVYEEARTYIDGLDIDDQCDLVALMWVGRGDYPSKEWAKARGIAVEQHSDHTAEYLLGTPLLADYLTEGLAQYDLSCDELEERGL